MNAVLAALILFSAQLLIVIGVAAIAASLSRITDPRFRLTYWRCVALACLALPLSALVGPAVDPSTPGPIALSLDAAQSVLVPIVPPAISTIAWWLLCAGTLARLGWLGAGAMRLRHFRRQSLTTVLTADLESLRSEIAPLADVRVSSQIARPAAFGLRRPIVLLPDSFFAMGPEAQRAVACHELLHVARRDWAWVVVEESARALFWFHPAVWWLVERIQTSREQLIDCLVVARIPSKRAYMAALLAFAEQPSRPVILATSILRKRHLRSRLQNLVKESVMSRRRLVWTAAVLAGVMAGAIAGTVKAFPLGLPMAAAAPQEQQVVEGNAPGITMPKLISQVKPRYTPEAMQAKIAGMVIMTAVVRTDGTPADIKVTKSLDSRLGLDKQAVAALSLWRFTPGMKDGKPVPVRVTIEMRFTLRE